MKEETVAYQEALDYLYRFVDYSLQRNFRFAPEKFNLDRMVLFLDLLGNPHLRYPVIHIAGTKGKGSTAAMVASGLRAAGYSVGLYTSPHLQDFTERIQVDGKEISHADLVTLVDWIRPSIEQVPEITWFEITTALAFVYFARRDVDVVVAEVGLGGRLDATNVVSPLVSVITSLSMDHMNILGDTLAKIAYEKAGIIKENRPVVVAPQKEDAWEVVAQVAAERNSPFVAIGRDYQYAALHHTLEGQSFQVWQKDQAHRADLFIPLLGIHQVENGATAYATLQEARKAGLEKIDEEAIRKGFASVSWPGRFELLRRQPPLIIDSAHNRDSAHRLRQTLDDYLPDWPVVLIFGASEDKDVAGMFAELLPRVSFLVATQSVHPRAIDADRFVELAKRFDCPAEACVPVENAIRLALAKAGKDKVVLATGSLFIAAAIRDIWQEMENQVSDPMPTETGKE